MLLCQTCSSIFNCPSVLQVPSGQKQQVVESNKSRKTRANHEPGLYDLPSFYSSDYAVRTEIPIETGVDPSTRMTTASLRMTSMDGSSKEDSELGGRSAPDSSSNEGIYRNKCVSFLALVAGLAAFGCSLAALAGTTNWVDTWEPIDLPPTQDWPLLFGTGYGSLIPSRSRPSSQSKSSWPPTTKGAASVYATSHPDLTAKSSWDRLPSGGHVAENVTVSPSFSAGTTRAPITVAFPRAPPVDKDDEFDYDDDDDYYAQDEAHQLMDDEEVVMLRHEEQDEDDQEVGTDDQQMRRALIVVFHVGLFRACPVLKGELPSSVGKSRNKILFTFWFGIRSTSQMPYFLKTKMPIAY